MTTFTAPAPVSVRDSKMTALPLHGQFRPSHVGDLPEYPAHLPPATVSFSFEDGKLASTIVVGDIVIDSIDDVDLWCVECGWDDDTMDMMIDWTEAVHRRIEANLYGLEIAATLDVDVKNAIIAEATDTEFTPEPVIFPAHEIDADPKKAAAARAERALEYWSGTGLGKATTNDVVLDALVDLRHWAAAQDVDLAQLLTASDEEYQDQIRVDA